MNSNVNGEFLAFEQLSKCDTSIIWGVYGIVLMFICFSLNSSLLGIILFNEDLRYTANKFIVAMLSTALIGSVTDLPLLVIKNFSCG